MNIKSCLSIVIIASLAVGYSLPASAQRERTERKEKVYKRKYYKSPRERDEQKAADERAPQQTEQRIEKMSRKDKWSRRNAEADSTRER